MTKFFKESKMVEGIIGIIEEANQKITKTVEEELDKIANDVFELLKQVIKMQI